MSSMFISRSLSRSRDVIYKVNQKDPMDFKYIEDLKGDANLTNVVLQKIYILFASKKIYILFRDYMASAFYFILF
jgi:hypothetical protein